MADPEKADKYLRAERLFARRIKELREERGWSQSEVAERMVQADIDYATQTTVSRIENLSRPVRMVEAQALALIFGVTIWELTSDDQRVSWLRLVRANTQTDARAVANFKTAAREVARARADAFQALSVLEDMGGVEDLLEDPDLGGFVKNAQGTLEAVLAFDAVDCVARALEEQGFEVSDAAPPYPAE